MYKLCKTEASAARQRALEQGFLEVMSHCRFEDLSITGLCRRLGVSRKSFYRYFSGKEGALLALIDHTLLAYEPFSASRMQGRPTLTGELEQFFAFWYAHRSLLSALERSDLTGILLRRCVAHALSQSVFPARFLPGDTLPLQREVVSFAVSALMLRVLQWHREGCCQTPRQLADIALRLLTQPLFPAAADLLR